MVTHTIAIQEEEEGGVGAETEVGDGGKTNAAVGMKEREGKGRGVEGAAAAAGFGVCNVAGTGGNRGGDGSANKDINQQKDSNQSSDESAGRTDSEKVDGVDAEEELTAAVGAPAPAAVGAAEQQKHQQWK